MRKLQNAVSGLIAVVVATWGMTAQADNHAAAKATPLEFWSCSFNKGKDMDDFNRATDAFNKWADANNDEYVGWILTPQTWGPGNTTDVAWLGSWPDGNAMGRQQDAWYSTGQKTFAGFMDVVTCSAHEMATSLPISASEEQPGDGVVLFSRCEVDDDSSLDKAIAAHRNLAAKLGGKHGGQSWLFFPGSGSADEGGGDYWLVLYFANNTALGAAWEHYTNGGGRPRLWCHCTRSRPS